MLVRSTCAQSPCLPLTDCMRDARCKVSGEMRNYGFLLMPSPSSPILESSVIFPFHFNSVSSNGSVVAPRLIFALSAYTPITWILLTLQLLQAIPAGVGQVYGCDNPWTGGLILVALFICSPLICLHAAIGSIVGMLAGKTEPHPVGRYGGEGS